MTNVASPRRRGPADNIWHGPRATLIPAGTGYRMQSSAKGRIVLLLASLGRSLMYIKNSMGPRIVRTLGHTGEDRMRIASLQKQFSAISLAKIVESR